MEVTSAVFVAIISLVLVYSVLTNLAVIVVVLRSSKMKTVTNILLVNLAISDILLAGVVLPLDLHDVLHADNFFERKLN